MDRFSTEQRDCYSEGEISLKYLPRDHGYRYEMSNCLFEAAVEKILQVRSEDTMQICVQICYVDLFSPEMQVLSWLPCHWR